ASFNRYGLFLWFILLDNRPLWSTNFFEFRNQKGNGLLRIRDVHVHADVFDLLVFGQHGAAARDLAKLVLGEQIVDRVLILLGSVLRHDLFGNLDVKKIGLTGELLCMPVTSAHQCKESENQRCGEVPHRLMPTLPSLEAGRWLAKCNRCGIRPSSACARLATITP